MIVEALVSLVKSLTLTVELFIFAVALRRRISMEPGIVDTVLALY